MLSMRCLLQCWARAFHMCIMCWTAITLVIYVTNVEAKISQSGGGGMERSGTVQSGGGSNYVSERTLIAYDLLHKYDHMLFPGFQSGNKTRVRCGIYVNSFDSISVSRMDVTLSIYLRQIWEDRRLQFENTHPDVPQITLDSNYQGRVWVPDTFFPNEKRAKKHRVTVPNSLLRIYQNGTVFHSARYTLILSCPMDLYKFPLDNQECKMKIESYSYAEDELELLWFLDKPIELAPDLHLPQFTLNGFTKGECAESYITGNYTCLEVKFQLGRKYGFYLVQTYIPSTLIVVLSWVSFWINHDAIPARISLGVLTVLSMTTESIGLWMTLPKVSYVKAIDIWISACVCFVFLSMMEFAAVNTLTRRDIRLSFRQPSFSDSKERKYFSDSDRQSSHSQGNGDVRKRYTRTLRKHQAVGRRLDKICRIAFPLSFIVFTISYWSTYLVI